MGKKSREKRTRRALQQTKVKPNRPIVLLGVSILFLIFGIFPTIQTMRDLLFWHSMQATTSVSGLLTKIDIKGYTNSRGGGGECVVAEYNYVVNGRAYHGSRPSLHTGGDNFGGFQRELYNRLERAFSHRLPIKVYVCNKNPSISCLDLTIRPSRIIVELLFPITFFGISLICLVQFLKMKRATKALEAMAKKPAAPQR